ncbi:hypothetical protein DRO55_01775 [Candidatus Bathyarchaeota archaeon]|nr:MAG: hypothetical protein DRO55_01775 [Candidatus Bathyarchaeota archaeon]
MKGGIIMKTSSKILIMLGVILIVTLPLLTSGAMIVNAMNGDSAAEGYMHKGFSRRRPLIVCRVRARTLWFRSFLKGASSVELDGSVVTHYKNILVISTSDGELNIILPPVWRDGSEVIRLETMFDNYLTPNEEVTIKALQRTYTNDEGVSFTVIIAYEITSEAGGYTVHAVLPFNIDTSG